MRNLSEIMRINNVCIFLHIVVLCFVLSSCFNNVYNFDERDFAWIDCYNEGDTIVFNTNDCTDYLYISKKTVYDDHHPTVENENQFWTDYHSHVYYNGKLKHKANSLRFWAEIFKCSDGCLGMYVSLGEKYFCSAQDSINLNENGTYFKDTIFIDMKKSQSEPKFAWKDCEYIKWAKGVGIVGYKFRDGTIYGE